MGSMEAWRSLSTNVVLPWSTWATMARFLIWRWGGLGGMSWRFKLNNERGKVVERFDDRVVA